MAMMDDALRDELEDLRLLPNKARLQLQVRDYAGAVATMNELDAKLFALVTRDDDDDEAPHG